MTKVKTRPDPDNRVDRMFSSSWNERSKNSEYTDRKYTCYGCGATELTYEEVCQHGREHAKEELIKDIDAEGY